MKVLITANKTFYYLSSYYVAVWLCITQTLAKYCYSLMSFKKYLSHLWNKSIENAFASAANECPLLSCHRHSLVNLCLHRSLACKH